MADFAMDYKFDAKYENAAVNLKIFAYGAEVPTSASLYDAQGKKVLDFASSSADVNGATRELSFKSELKGVNLWSAEKPYLYTLVMNVGGDIRSKKVGFKEL